MSSEIERENFTSAYRMISKAESINAMRVSPNGLEARALDIDMAERRDVSVRCSKTEHLLKRQKGGDGFYKMIGLPRLASYSRLCGIAVSNPVPVANFSCRTRPRAQSSTPLNRAHRDPE